MFYRLHHDHVWTHVGELMARDDTTVAYMRHRDVDWLADFTLHIVEFVVKTKAEMHPAPAVDGKKVPQFPPFPGYALAHITWPARGAPDGG